MLTCPNIKSFMVSEMLNDIQQFSAITPDTLDACEEDHEADKIPITQFLCTLRPGTFRYDILT